jgi:large subunit ribosomal protein L4
VVRDFELKEVKTAAFREALDALKVEKTALLVDNSKENRNLELSARNLKGVELLPGSAVHPYHLLRYDRAIFTQPALERLQASLKATAPKKKAEVA